MKIEIEINKKVAKHLASPHTFYDGCEEENTVMRKVQKEIDKKLEKKR